MLYCVRGPNPGGTGRVFGLSGANDGGQNLEDANVLGAFLDFWFDLILAMTPRVTSALKTLEDSLSSSSWTASIRLPARITTACMPSRETSKPAATPFQSTFQTRLYTSLQGLSRASTCLSTGIHSQGYTQPNYVASAHHHFLASDASPSIRLLHCGPG